MPTVLSTKVTNSPHAFLSSSCKRGLREKINKSPARLLPWLLIGAFLYTSMMGSARGAGGAGGIAKAFKMMNSTASKVLCKLCARFDSASLVLSRACRWTRQYLFARVKWNPSVAPWKKAPP